MTFLDWVLWGALLGGQAGANTFVSRARNSTNLGYHAVASVFSNGVWILQFFLAVDYFTRARGDWAMVGALITFYVVMTVSGSVASHWFLMHKVERRIRT